MKSNSSKNFILCFLILLNILTRPYSAAASETKADPIQYLSLKQAKHLALKNNPGLAAAQERVNQAREAIVQARAAYLPTISTTTAWNYTENVQVQPAAYNENLYTNKISATLLLFDGFARKYATLAANCDEKMTQAARKDAQRLLAWSVAQSFLNIQLSRENIKIAQSDMAFNQIQAREALAREKAGTGSLSDLLNFKTRVNTAKAILISSRQEIKASCHGLAALMGLSNAILPENMKIEPMKNDDIDAEAQKIKQSTPMTDMEKTMETLLEERPDLLRAEYAIKAADARIYMAASGYYPTVSLTGSHGTASGDTFHDMTDPHAMGSAMGVSVNFELFSGGSTRSSVRKARWAKKELTKELESSRLSAVSEIKTAAEHIQSARQQLDLQRKNAILVERVRNLVEKEYAAGQASLVRLNEVQNNLIGAQGDLAKARVSLILAMEQFDYYTGNNIQ